MVFSSIYLRISIDNTNLMKILLIDDHRLFSAGLEILLQELCPGVNITVADGIAKALEKTNSYDLILLDFFLPDCKRLDGLLRIRRHYSDVPIAIISSDLDARNIRDCIDHGAMGFVSKSSTPKELLKAIKAILSGETYLPAYCVTDLPPLQRHATPVIDLSPRQKEVLTLVRMGKPDKVIAKELGISDQTVKSHVVAVLSALGARNRTEAMYRAASLGI
jgi:two-component system, NarL family, nitrate/nitrite response regulator NarL